VKKKNKRGSEEDGNGIIVLGRAQILIIIPITQKLFKHYWLARRRVLDVMQNGRLNPNNQEISSLSLAHREARFACGSPSMLYLHIHYNYCRLVRCKANYWIRHNAMSAEEHQAQL